MAPVLLDLAVISTTIFHSFSTVTDNHRGYTTIKALPRVLKVNDWIIQAQMKSYPCAEENISHSLTCCFCCRSKFRVIQGPE